VPIVCSGNRRLQLRAEISSCVHLGSQPSARFRRNATAAQHQAAIAGPAVKCAALDKQVSAQEHRSAHAIKSAKTDTARIGQNRRITPSASIRPTSYV
jgi:hypothetical protein